MPFTTWLLLAGLLFLVMALSAAMLHKLPVSSAMLYLGVGVALGPAGTALVAFDAVDDAAMLEHLSTVAVIISLFVGGMKLRLPLRDPAWRAAWLLAGPVMITTIGLVAVFSSWAFGFSAGEALLLGAILAPTDPVLAAEAKVESARDNDRLRYALSGEAGLNDGAAFPFVVFALLWIDHGGPEQGWVASWALERIVWAVPAGLVIGVVIGRAAGHLQTFVHARFPEAPGLHDFLVLALIALPYAIAESVHAWGFLACFAAGIGLRHAEASVVRHRPPPDVRALEEGVDTTPPHEAPAEAVVERDLSDEALSHPAVAAGTMMSEAISFGDALERIAEVVIVILLGVMVSTRFDARGLLLAVVLFAVARPVVVALGLIRSPTTGAQRGLIAWLGIRGVGTIYYLAHALVAGFDRSPAAAAVTDIALTTVVASIVVHGLSATPLLRRYTAMVEKAGAPSQG